MHVPASRRRLAAAFRPPAYGIPYGLVMAVARGDDSEHACTRICEPVQVYMSATALAAAAHVDRIIVCYKAYVHSRSALWQASSCRPLKPDSWISVLFGKHLRGCMLFTGPGAATCVGGRAQLGLGMRLRQ